MRGFWKLRALWMVVAATCLAQIASMIDSELFNGTEMVEAFLPSTSLVVKQDQKMKATSRVRGSIIDQEAERNL